MSKILKEYRYCVEGCEGNQLEAVVKGAIKNATKRGNLRDLRLVCSRIIEEIDSTGGVPDETPESIG